MARTSRGGDETTLRRLRASLESAAIDLDVRTVGAEWTCPSAIERSGDWLVWDPRAPSRTWRDPRPDFLIRFAELAQVPEDRFQDAVLRYARQWGVLELCQHGLPDTHARNAGAPPFAETADDCHGWKVADGRSIEAIGPWRRLAAQADGILRAAAALDHGKKVGEDTWASFAELFPLNFWPRATTSIHRGHELSAAQLSEITVTDDMKFMWTVHAFGNQEQAVAFAVRRWLDMADVRPVFTWTSTGFGARTLFGGLALRLATALANRTERPKLCRYGDHLYKPRPRERRASAFCDEREECKRKRWAENARRSRTGEATRRGPYKRVATTVEETTL